MTQSDCNFVTENYLNVLIALMVHIVIKITNKFTLEPKSHIYLGTHFLVSTISTMSLQLGGLDKNLNLVSSISLQTIKSLP